MIRTLMGATAAVALLAASGAFAATTQPYSVGQPQLQQKAAVHHKDQDVIGDRETAALNTLEASGYFWVKDMHPDGKNISVDAKKPGADFVHLTVQPNGTINPAT